MIYPLFNALFILIIINYIRKSVITDRNEVTIMSEDDGHFENGKWVKNTPPEPKEEEPTGYKERVNSATDLIRQGIGELLSVTNDLVMTKEGKKHIGKKLDKATEEVMKAYDELGKQVGVETVNLGKKMDKATEEVKKISGEMGKQVNDGTQQLSKKISAATDEVVKTGEGIGDQISEIISHAKNKIRK